MEYSSQETQLLTQVLPNIAAQFRTALGNMQAALKTGDDPDSCILRQSYYRLLRIVTNLTDAYMLTEEEPLPKQDTELVEFFDNLCRQAQVPLELCGLTLRADLRPVTLRRASIGSIPPAFFGTLYPTPPSSRRPAARSA